MHRASRNTRRRHLAALAAIGLISMTCSAPALGLENVNTSRPINVEDAYNGLTILTPENAANGTVAEWHIPGMAAGQQSIISYMPDTASQGVIFEDSGGGGNLVAQT